MIETQYRFWKDYRAQLDREISFLNKFAEEEKGRLSEAMNQIKHLSDPEQQLQSAYTTPKAVSDFIDKQASRHFSIYADQAKVNGYGFQANLAQKKIVPKIDKSLADMISEKVAFDRAVSHEIRDLIPNRWQWRQMAQKVGMVNEYDFIYTFSSKLLHATPASITTDQKNLELPEFVMFLKYIYVKIADIVELANAYSL